MEPKHIEMIQSTAKDCMLFRDMSVEELSALLTCLDFRVRSFGRNDIINMAGDPFEGIGVVVDGQVAVVKENVAGERLVFDILGRGELFGEMAAFTGVRKWPATIIANSDCTVMYVPADKLVGQCSNSCIAHTRLIMNMLGILSRKALTLNRQLEYLSIKSIRGRIASFLLEQYKKHGKTTFMLTMNRNELADFLNVARPSLSREMCRMRDEGMIDFHRSSVRIRDVEALRAAAQGLN
ncbi:MAG TPA: Crp/Fnr family transcriptional regulator [Clostridiales bacterium]|nr:Crp/Fnr family transcriptional regulator [Clostridiales bacterium]